MTVSGAAGKLLEAPTRPDGKLFFFPGTVGGQAGDDLHIEATLGAATATAAVTAKVGDAELGDLPEPGRRDPGRGPWIPRSSSTPRAAWATSSST